MESRELGMGIPIYEGSRRIVLPHGDKGVPPMDNAFCCLFFRERIKDLHDLLNGESALLVHVVGLQFDIYLLPYKLVHSLGFLGVNNKFGGNLRNFVVFLSILRTCRYLRLCV